MWPPPLWAPSAQMLARPSPAKAQGGPACSALTSPGQDEDVLLAEALSQGHLGELLQQLRTQHLGPPCHQESRGGGRAALHPPRIALPWHVPGCVLEGQCTYHTG